ncbi:DUF6788 family protein [Acaryochloris sp. IP29b_bin.148]|uniref:DUF6788 family protein n=1 Tax=Acaryochloris sp. IP29b_bin.148 TaxID=2969218 RepID=UPI0034523ADD
MPFGLTQLKPAITKLSLNKKQRLLEWLQAEIKAETQEQSPHKAKKEVEAVYQLEYVRCGKETCKCSSGRTEDMHGPYWYSYERNSKGKLVSRYIGKKLRIPQ